MFYSLAKFLIGTYARLRFRYSVTGLDQVPSRGRIIIAANHHSNWDPIFVGIGINRPLRFMAKMELFQSPLSREIFHRLGAFPVNRGAGDTRAIRSALAILNNEEALALFPEGTRVKPGETKDAQNGIALLAAKTKSPVVPVRVWRNGRQVEVRVGKPVSFQLPLGKSKADRDDLNNFSQLIMTKIRNL